MKFNAYYNTLLKTIAMLIVLSTTAIAQENLQDLPKYGEDSIKCVENISLYREFFRQWKAADYQSPVVNDIIGPWRWVFQNCPLGSENTYVDGVKIMQHQIENEEDIQAKALLIDTLMMVYDQRITYFPYHFRTGNPQKGAILGRKGMDLMTYAPTRYEESYQIMNESIELEGDNADGTVLIYYFRSAVRMVQESKIDTAALVDIYDRIIDILDHNIVGLTQAGDTRWVEHYRNYKANIDVTFEPFASCPDLIRVYSKKWNDNPDDIELLTKITNLLDRRGCQDDPLYLNASVKLHKLQPSPESAYNIGRLMLREDKYGEAIKYFEEATHSEDMTKAFNAYKLLAETLRALKNYPRARQMALKAIELNPSDGSPYITIGDIYASGAKECGDNEFTSRVSFWAAVDKYNQAKRIDPSQTEIANKRIATYSVYFPSLETIFFYGYEEGKPYVIECWFREETIVRAAK
ncbi:MAG: tetratricopeptide repeat protein [Bacteroidales bacterium]|jgi:tetratricopeptide (TPR) repeat protein|nr:tetratricopeptide repeat protein [Bacteroidales bacterium]MCK9447788.1 tetratricopeptide repeat protein [Bacteroidales bacterium]MDD3700105.1 tetratricopeptide repeat protein [Bacteroidales bacterium]MDY0369071.1 tetratricopeptide repeat protein [Bacteroidales bacterium]